MTTIAWDGRSLASDKRANVGGTRLTVTKIRRGLKGNLVGVSGTFAMSNDLFRWLCTGGARPVGQGDHSDWCPVMEITAKGEVLRHERWGSFRVEDPFYAIGSGADFALAAMSLGADAAQAVEIAARFDTSTGDGVDILPLHLPALRAPRARPAAAPAPTARRKRPV